MNEKVETNTGDKKSSNLLIWEALQDIGWFPVILALMGGISVYSALEVLNTGSLDGVAGSFAAGLERLRQLVDVAIAPTAAWLVEFTGDFTGQDLVLYSHWRDMFLLSMSLVLSSSRIVWKESIRAGDRAPQIKTIAVLLLLGLVALFSSVCSGLIRADGSYEAESAIFNIPSFSLTLAIGCIFGERGKQVFNVASTLACQLIAIGLGFAFDQMSIGLQGGAQSFAIFLLLLGLAATYWGLKKKGTFELRFGLLMLGFFVAAGVVLLAQHYVLVK